MSVIHNATINLWGDEIGGQFVFYCNFHLVLVNKKLGRDQLSSIIGYIPLLRC